MSKKSIATLLLVAGNMGCVNTPTGAETQPTKDSWPKLQQFGEHQYRVYEDGSGTFGKNVKNVLANYWSIRNESDEMTDRQIITVSKSGIMPDNDNLSVGMSLHLDLSINNEERLCVLGHNFPGKTATIRIDSNAPIYTDKKGCVDLTSDLDASLRAAQLVLVRGSEWPKGLSAVGTVDMDGYDEVTDLLRSTR